MLGTVFLLGTMRVLSLGRLAHLFANYWPVLLILWGVIKLIEHQQAQREGTRAPGIGAGGVFLVIMIVVFGLIATQLEHVNWSGLRDQFNFDDGDFNDIFGQTYNFDDHLEQDFPAGASLKVIDTHGAISVHASDDNKITVVVRKRVGADNQNDADKYNNETKPTITTIGGLVTVDAKAEAAGDHPVETDLDISVPRKAPVTVTSRRGDVNVVGRDGNVDISAQHSDTSVEDVNGNVKVSQEKGSVKIEQITGDVHVRRPGQRSLRVPTSKVGATRRRISGEREAGADRENCHFQVFAHRHGIFAHRWLARSRFRRTARRTDHRPAAPDHALEKHPAGSSLRRCPPAGR